LTPLDFGLQGFDPLGLWTSEVLCCTPTGEARPGELGSRPFFKLGPGTRPFFEPRTWEPGGAKNVVSDLSERHLGYLGHSLDHIYVTQ
jgi:hypothetical protein